MHFAKLALVGTVVGSMMLATGCASTPEECDPSQDVGFFNKIGCTVSGSYGERVEQKQQHIADLKAENERLNALTRSIYDESAKLRGEYATRVKTLDQIEDELYGIKDSLAQKKALNSSLEAKFKAAETQVNEMQRAGENQTLLEKQAQINELQATLEELENAMLDQTL